MVLTLIEIIVFGVVLYFCSTQHKWSFGWHVQKEKGSKTAPNRRRSYHGVSGHEAPKIHKRRPSEEALNISGKDHFKFNIQYWIIIFTSLLCAVILLIKGSQQQAICSFFVMK